VAAEDRVEVTKPDKGLADAFDETFHVLGEVVSRHTSRIKSEEIGTVTFVGNNIVRLEGLPSVQSEEIILFSDGVIGMVLNLEPGEVGAILLGESRRLSAGSEARRSGRVLDAPVGEGLLGRVISPTGRIMDGGGPLKTVERRPVERDAPDVMDRDPVVIPLQTGIKSIDALIPVGRGQRELILGDRQTGKTAIAIDTIINQRDQDVICVYCAIGQRSGGVAGVIADLQKYKAMDYSIVVAATAEEPPGLQYIAPYAATTMAEYFTEQGRDVLIVYDDLTRHAWAYREISLLLRRPPGREAYPGDIFYIHSRLLERATRLNEAKGSGTLTALPIAETEAQNVSAYIPTNLISITDGQIYLNPELFQKGVLPAVDVGESVSRVGGKTQLAAYRAVAGDLRLSYSQFEELETFARFGTRLDEDTRRTIERGRRVREVLKQAQYQPMPVAEQIAALLAVTSGVFDDVPIDKVGQAEAAVHLAMRESLSDIEELILSGENLEDEHREAILETARNAVEDFTKQAEDANP
jgi:F-type H+/Na+-transporting ATPase subunit alpha